MKQRHSVTAAIVGLTGGRWSHAVGHLASQRMVSSTRATGPLLSASALVTVSILLWGAPLSPAHAQDSAERWVNDSVDGVEYRFSLPRGFDRESPEYGANWYRRYLGPDGSLGCESFRECFIVNVSVDVEDPITSVEEAGERTIRYTPREVTEAGEIEGGFRVRAENSSGDQLEVVVSRYFRLNGSTSALECKGHFVGRVTADRVRDTVATIESICSSLEVLAVTPDQSADSE